MKPSFPHTSLCHYTKDAVFYRDDNLVEDLLGKASFLDVFMKQAFNRSPTQSEIRLIDAVLVCLMEHGMTPSAIAARMIYSSSPENIQAGVAAGLLAVGSRFVGTMEDCAQFLGQIAGAQDGRATARKIADDFRARREPVPGFGHHLHKPDDPRAPALLALARELGHSGGFAQALALLAQEVDVAASRHITINATGAIAAVLGDLDIPPKLMRAFAVLARAAGLIAHIAEEQTVPAGRSIWQLVDHAMAVSPAEEVAQK
jgi:citrate synthase